MEEKLKTKLGKLFALSQRGVGGEKRNANNMLLSLLKKHGLTMLDVEQEAKRDYWFKWVDEYERKLLDQLFYKIIGRGFDAWTSRKKRKQVCVVVSPSVMLEIEIQFSIYKKSLKEGLITYYQAFVQKNNIFPKQNGDVAGQKMTDEEIEKLTRMMRVVGKTNINKQIES
jgi:hypothetical protein